MGWPRKLAPGTEVSGVEIGADPPCRRLKVGDEVVAMLDRGEPPVHGQTKRDAHDPTCG